MKKIEIVGKNSIKKIETENQKSARPISLEYYKLASYQFLGPGVIYEYLSENRKLDIPFFHSLRCFGQPYNRVSFVNGPSRVTQGCQIYQGFRFSERHSQIIPEPMIWYMQQVYSF